MILLLLEASENCTTLCTHVVALREILPEQGTGPNSLFQAGLDGQRIKQHADI